jgi:hypothetical protein
MKPPDGGKCRKIRTITRPPEEPTSTRVADGIKTATGAVSDAIG